MTNLEIVKNRLFVFKEYTLKKLSRGGSESALPLQDFPCTPPVEVDPNVANAMATAIGMTPVWVCVIF